jgi:hypothetical protein
MVTTENLDRFGQLQDLPDAFGLLASSPAFKYARPNGCCRFILKCLQIDLQRFFKKYALDEKLSVRFVAHPIYKISYPYVSSFVLVVSVSTGLRFGPSEGIGRCDRLWTGPSRIPTAARCPVTRSLVNLLSTRHQIACFKATEGLRPPYRAALSQQYSVASFGTVRVLSCLHSPGLRSSFCNRC